MVNYKNIIKNQEIRFKILGLLDFVPDNIMLKLQYRIKTGRNLNLSNPKRFTEKLQWYKLYYRDPLMTKCVDKYFVREYVISKGYQEILIPLFGVYENAKHINFDELPQKFVLKTTNGSHTNIICENKNELDRHKTINTLNNWLHKRPVKLGREWAYYDVEPRIICEQFLIDENNKFKGINDYKFICMNGKVEYIWIDLNRYDDHKRNFYDSEWNYINVSSDVPNYGDTIVKPEGLNKMIEIASNLSRDFPQVRVDLYWVNNRVYFGELTFYLLSGYEDFKPDEFDFVLGEKFVLPESSK